MRQSSDNCVYLLTFDNGKQYVGVTGDVRKRLWEHKSRNAVVGAAMRKHAFRHEVVFEGDREECFKREMELIAELGTQAPNGYNLTPGGDGVRYTPELRAKLSAAAKAQHASPEGKAKHVAGCLKRYAGRPT